MEVYDGVHDNRVYVGERTGTSARGTNGVGDEVEGVGAGFAHRGRARKTVGVETMGDGIFEVAF